MKLGYASIQYSPKFLSDGPGILHQIDAAADAGFSWLALDRHTVGRCEQDGSLAQLAAACRERLPCRELHGLIATDDAAALADASVRLAEHARLFGSPLVLTVVKAPPSPAIIRALAAAADRLATLDPPAALGIEFSPLFAVATLTEARALCDLIDRPNTGVVVDTWHFFHGDTSWPALDALPLEQLLMVHFNDHGALESGDIQIEKDRRLEPGSGRFALRRFAAVILDKGYRGGVEIEVVSEALRALPVTEYARCTFEAGARFWPDPTKEDA